MFEELVPDTIVYLTSNIKAGEKRAIVRHEDSF